MRRFFSVLLAFIMALALIGLGLGVATQFVDSVDVCTVTGTEAIEIRERRIAYRIMTTECGTFSASAIPLRGIETEDARHMFERVNIGEVYRITYIREGFGVFAVNPAIVEIQPHN